VRSYYQTVHDLSSMLSDAHISVYPVDAEGLRALSTFDASQSGRVNGRLATGPEFMAITSQAAAGIQAAHFTMQDIAEQTGGRAFFNRNDLDRAVQAAAEDGSSYYALAFRPEKYVADGRMHELKLKCKRAGVQLRYRHGYFALDPYDPRHPDPDRLKWMQNEMRDALLAQKQLETGVPLQAALQNGSHAELLLQPGALTFGSEPAGKHRATLEIVTAAFDEKGKAVATDAHVYQIVLDDDRYKQAASMPMRQPVTFQVRPDAKRLRIAVRDLNTDRIGTVDLPLTPTEASR
jgi:hypothetical protein